MTSPHTPVRKEVFRGDYNSLWYHQTDKLPSGSLFSVFPPVTVKVSLLLVKTNLSPHALDPKPFHLLKVFISPAPWVSPPLLDYSIRMQTCFCFPSTKNSNNSLDPHIVFQLPPFSFTNELVYASCLYFLTSHSLLHLFHLVSIPTTSLKLFLSKSPMTSMLSNSMDIFLFVFSSASQHLPPGQPLFLEMPLPQPS